MNTTRNEMKTEAAEKIIEILENGYNGYYEDLHNEVFNTDYYITEIYEAKEVLNEYDVFDAIEEVQEYEKNNFRESYTDIRDPKKLINMLFYIIGDEVLYNLESFTDKSGTATEEENNEIIEELKKEYNL